MTKAADTSDVVMKGGTGTDRVDDLVIQAQRGQHSGRPGDTAVSAGRGGSIIFKCADSETFRLDPDGRVLVRGDVVTHDIAMYRAFAEWLRQAGVSYNKGRCEIGVGDPTKAK